MVPEQPTLRRGLLWLAVALLAIGGVVYVIRNVGDERLSPGTPAYQAVTSSFHIGLASLQAGLLDRAEQEFLRASEIAPQEPAILANLGLLHLRLGDLDEAASYLERAQALAAESPQIAVLQGLVESRRGRLEQGIVHLRRAVELDPGKPAGDVSARSGSGTCKWKRQ